MQRSVDRIRHGDREGRGRSSDRIGGWLGGLAEFASDRSRFEAGHAAGIEQREVGEPHRHVEGDAVVAHAALDAQPDGPDLAAAAIAPAARKALTRARLDAEVRAGLCQCGLERSNERPDQELPIRQLDDHIGGQLARTMVSHLAAALRLDDLDLACRKLGRSRQHVAGVAVAAQCQHRIMLEQEQLVADFARVSSRDQAMLQVPGVAICGPAEPPRCDRRGRGASTHGRVGTSIRGRAGGGLGRRVFHETIHRHHDSKRP